MQDPVRKIIKVKSFGGMAQVVVHLASRFEGLSSNPSIIQNKSLYKGQPHIIIFHTKKLKITTPVFQNCPFVLCPCF
jgi:hypothetical protein